MAETIKRPKIVGDYYVNQYGVKIPVKDVEQFRRNIDAINKRAKRQVEKYSKFERMIDNQPTGQRVGDLMRMGYEPELAYAHRTANLNQFQDIETFKKRLKSTKKALSKDYIKERNQAYKRNYITGLIHNFGDKATPLINKIKNMNLDEFVKKVVTNPDQLSIKAQYDGNGTEVGQLYQLAQAWGAKKALASYEQSLAIV